MNAGPGSFRIDITALLSVAGWGTIRGPGIDGCGTLPGVGVGSCGTPPGADIGGCGRAAEGGGGITGPEPSAAATYDVRLIAAGA